GREELRLVDQQARDVLARELAASGTVRGEVRADVVVGADHEVDAPVHPEARQDLATRLRVDPRLGEHDLVLALLVVVGGLQERRRLARVHRPVAEVELGHGPDSSISRGSTSAARAPELERTSRRAPRQPRGGSTVSTRSTNTANSTMNVRKNSSVSG